MTLRRLISAAATALCVLMLAGCGKDPEVLKREFVKSGDDYVAQQKFAEAVIQYRNAVQQDPRFGEARKKLADAYRKTGDLTNAYRESVRAADLLPNDVDAQVTAGEMLLLARQFDDALSRGAKALAIDPKHVEAQILRANALAGLNKLDDAIAEVEEAIRNEPDRTASYGSLGIMQLLRGARPEAEAAFRKAVDTDPKSVAARLALANYYWVIGRRPEAEVHLKAALAIDPRHATANRALALLYVESRRVKEAEPYLKTLSEVLPESIGSLTLADYYLAIGRREEGRKVLETVAAGGAKSSIAAKLRLAGLAGAADLPTATRLVDEALAKNPRSAEALLAKGQVLILAGKPDEALGAVQTAVQVSPESPAVQFALGRLQAARGDSRAALAAFTEALKLNPRMAIAEVEVAKLHLAATDLNLAEQFAQAAVTKVPGYVEAHLILARIGLMQGDVVKVEPRIRALAKALPQVPAVQGELGQLELLKKNRPAARAAFQRALAGNPLQLDAIGGLVAMDIGERNGAAAKAHLATALQAAPKHTDLLLLASKTHELLGDAAGTERFARQAVEVDPNKIEAYSVLGRLYITQGRLDEAITQFTTVAAKEPRPVAACTILGVLKQMQGKTAEARKEYERALGFDSRAAVAANNLAWMYAESGGNLDVALQLAKTAKAGLPNRADVNDTLGWVYYKKGMQSLAVPPFVEAVAKDARNPTYHFHLGLAYAAMGDKDKARASLEKSLALDAKFDGAAEARQTLASLKS